jgi:ATP-dependent 26S proteasome regulatory subunit
MGNGSLVLKKKKIIHHVSDSALVRPGRFDKHIAVLMPDIRGRVQILQHYIKDVKASKGMRGLYHVLIYS